MPKDEVHEWFAGIGPACLQQLPEELPDLQALKDRLIATHPGLVAAVGNEVRLERLLAHTLPGEQSRVASVYNRFKYIPQMRQALLTYHEHLAKHFPLT
jgi:hypothetical protein